MTLTGKELLKEYCTKKKELSDMKYMFKINLTSTNISISQRRKHMKDFQSLTTYVLLMHDKICDSLQNVVLEIDIEFENEKAA